MRRQAGVRLRVDPIACDGIGMCAHVAPDLIRVDAWGYPIVATHPVSGRSEVRQAKAAVRVCPRRALSVREPV
ncbi:MAG: ferredoxin [Jatrophihabitans sp.]|nr:ferredoxin [Jatrophihabitans sp.]